MKTTIYNIDQDQLTEILESALKEAFKFEWTGWRLPIFISEDGEAFSGSWMSQNSYQPGVFELPIRIESWELDYDPTEEEINSEIEERIEFILNNLKEKAGEYFGAFSFEIKL